MLEELDQMLEISYALEEALEKKDVDRVVTLLKRRKELTDAMEPMDPGHPDVKSGKAVEKLNVLVNLDADLESKLRNLMAELQTAIQTIQGETKVVKGYLKKSGSEDPKYIDKEG
ncbi:flagellar protein FliT [bacterium]|jgi:hypothetical protein|nr:flagellar protein FliT [bacterium]